MTSPQERPWRFSAHGCPFCQCPGDPIAGAYEPESASLATVVAELRAIRALLQPTPEPEQESRVDPVAAVAVAGSVAELKAAGLWKQR